MGLHSEMVCHNYTRIPDEGSTLEAHGFDVRSRRWAFDWILFVASFDSGAPAIEPRLLDASHGKLLHGNHVVLSPCSLRDPSHYNYPTCVFSGSTRPTVLSKRVIEV